MLNLTAWPARMSRKKWTAERPCRTIPPIVSKKIHKINIRVDDEELQGLEQTFEVGRSKSHGHATRTAMLKELIGLLPQDLFDERDRELLRNRRKHTKKGKM